MASSAVAARQAGDELESALMEEASPERTKLTLLRSMGAVTRLRPAVGGKAFRQCYFPDRPAWEPEGVAQATTGVDALVGTSFAEAEDVVPDDPGAVRALVPVVTAAQRAAARAAAEAAAAAAAKAARAKEREAQGAKRKAKKAARKRRPSSSSGSDSGSESGNSSSSGPSSESDSSTGPPNKKAARSRHARMQPAMPPPREAILRTITPPGGDSLAAAAALFESARLREAAGVEALPPQAEWSLDRQAGLMRRCALGLEALDKALGGERWRRDRPKTMGAVYVLAEDAVAMLGRGPGAATARLTPKVRRRRSRSSSASSSGSSDSARAKSKKKRSTGKSGKAALSADAAEALNKARAFIEVAGGDGRGRGAAAAAAAALPTELRSLVQRALTADSVNGKSEQRSSRRELPLVVQRLREGLERDVARALEAHMSADMSGFSELSRPTAESLAIRIRRLDLSVPEAIKAVAAARGATRAPAQGSALELQDAWSLLRAGLDELDRAVPVVGRAAEQVAAQLSTGAAASGVSVAKLREWLERVCTSLGTMASDARQEVTLPVPTLEAALKLRSAWLYNEVQDARQDARQDRRHPAKGAGGKFERSERSPKGPPTKEVAPGGKGAGGKRRWWQGGGRQGGGWRQEALVGGQAVHRRRAVCVPQSEVCREAR